MGQSMAGALITPVLRADGYPGSTRAAVVQAGRRAPAGSLPADWLAFPSRFGPGGRAAFALRGLAARPAGRGHVPHADPEPA